MPGRETPPVTPQDTAQYPWVRFRGSEARGGGGGRKHGFGVRVSNASARERIVAADKRARVRGRATRASLTVSGSTALLPSPTRAAATGVVSARQPSRAARPPLAAQHSTSALQRSQSRATMQAPREAGTGQRRSLRRPASAKLIRGSGGSARDVAAGRNAASTSVRALAGPSDTTDTEHKSVESPAPTPLPTHGSEAATGRAVPGVVESERSAQAVGAASPQRAHAQQRRSKLPRAQVPDERTPPARVLEVTLASAAGVVAAPVAAQLGVGRRRHEPPARARARRPNAWVPSPVRAPPDAEAQGLASTTTVATVGAGTSAGIIGAGGDVRRLGVVRSPQHAPPPPASKQGSSDDASAHRGQPNLTPRQWQAQATTVRYQSLAPPQRSVQKQQPAPSSHERRGWSQQGQISNRQPLSDSRPQSASASRPPRLVVSPASNVAPPAVESTERTTLRAASGMSRTLRRSGLAAGLVKEARAPAAPSSSSAASSSGAGAREPARARRSGRKAQEVRERLKHAKRLARRERHERRRAERKARELQDRIAAIEPKVRTRQRESAAKWYKSGGDAHNVHLDSGKLHGTFFSYQRG